MNEESIGGKVGCYKTIEAYSCENFKEHIIVRQVKKNI